jgi:DNA-binding NarL/FixJ family response regulator
LKNILKKSKMIRTVIFENQPFFCDGLECALKDNPDICVVGKADNSRTFIKLIAETTADVALIGVNAPDLVGCINIIRHLKTEHPRIKILALANNTTVKLVESMWGEGVEGYISKRYATREELEIAIRKLAAGEIHTGEINGISKKNRNQ